MNYSEESIVRSYAYDNIADKVVQHKLCYQYYLSVSVPENPAKKEDIQPLIELHYHAFMAKEFDKAAEIIVNNKLHQKLNQWGNYRTLEELCTMLLPKDHFKDKPILSNINNHLRMLTYIGFSHLQRGGTSYRRAIVYFEKALEVVGIEEQE